MSPACKVYVYCQQNEKKKKKNPSVELLWAEAYLIGMRPVLVLGSVRGIGKSFIAAFMFTDIGFFSSVGPQVCL